MTENEKLVRDETEAIECLKSNKPTSGYLMLQESIDMAIKALEEVQQYRELTDRLKAIYGDQMTLKDMVDVMERIIREPGRKDPVNARILTYDEAAMWDEYRKIGTPEECLRNKDFLDFLSDKMDPDDFEMYLHIYNSLDEKGNNNDGE